MQHKTVTASGTYDTQWADLCQTHKRYAQFYNANIETVKTTSSALKDALHGFIKHFLKPGLVVGVVATVATVPVRSPIAL